MNIEELKAIDEVKDIDEVKYESVFAGRVKTHSSLNEADAFFENMKKLANACDLGLQDRPSNGVWIIINK